MVPTNIFTRFAVAKEKICLDENTILRLLGYNGMKAEPFVIETIKTCIHSSLSMISPTGGFVIKNIRSLEPKSGLLNIDGYIFNIHKIIASQLKNSELVALFVTTIGRNVENKSSECFQEGNMLEGYIYNLIGSEIAESAAEYIQNKIKETVAAEMFQITNRFSPGYCNWDVKEQFQLFNLLPKEFDEISLTESGLMNPVKSVSGIIGIGKNVKYGAYKCKFCKDEKCIYREKKSAEFPQ
jgi:hypothetical protein